VITEILILVVHDNSCAPQKSLAKFQKGRSPMKIFCLGGAGRICREAVLDLVQFSDATRITVADINESAGREVVEWVNDPRVDFVRADVQQHTGAVSKMRGFDVVMDGTTLALNGLSTACIAEAGCHAINLNGFGEEDASDAVFKQHGKTCVPGFGMTAGTTQMMVMRAAATLDTVEIIRASHGAYRPIAFSASITETTTYEYDPNLPSRVVFEDGEFKQVPPMRAHLPPDGAMLLSICQHPTSWCAFVVQAHDAARKAAHTCLLSLRHFVVASVRAVRRLTD
jgi:saccharopine dehydrogenase-like NADP-dependent oxidoreductase